MSADPIPWGAAVVWSLTGESAPQGESSLPVEPDAAAIARWFDQGDRLARVRSYAAARRARDEPWPVPVPAALGVPPAQLSALVWAVRTRLGLIGTVAPPAAARPLSADEQRLLRDVPPHF